MKAITSLALGASILCLSTAISGAAQAEQAQPAGAPAAADATVDNSGIADIIVTANRRAERLQDVPIAVTAVTGAQVAARGVVTTQSLPALAPSLSITQNGIAANFFLRGVGLFGGNANNESSVALYVDGVYQAAPQGNLFSLADIERVEVLKGPQGTLFGRNATAGVIQIITKTPSHTASIDATGGYASYRTVFGSVYATGGLTDTLAVSLSAQGSHQGHGWGTDLTTGNATFKQWNYLLRGKALWEPTDNLKITVSADYNRNKNPGVSPQPGPGASTIAGPQQTNPGRFNTFGDSDDYGKVKSRGVSARVDYDGGAVHLASISAYRKDDNFFRLDQDGSSVPAILADITGREREITQELQASNGPDSKLVWLLGVYYFNYHTAYDRLKLAGLVDFLAIQNSQSMAAFGQATYPITDTTHITAGIRYTTEDQHYNGTLFADNTNFVVVGPVAARQSFTVPTWRLSIDQKLTPDILAYVSYNRGFKSGGYSLVVTPGTTPPFKPEKLDAYEVGLKSTLLDRHLQLNVASFYYDYSNIQIQVTNGGNAYLYNGPKAKIYGGEVEAQYRLTEQLTLTANASYLHARYGDFPGAVREDQIPASGIIPAGCIGAGTGGARPGSNCVVQNYNAKGQKLIYAPDWTYTLGADYAIPTSIGKFDINASVYYYGGSYASPDNRLKNPKYYLVNGSIGWASDDGRFGVTVFGRNLANEYYYASAYEQDFNDTVTAQEPRVFGVRFNVKY